MFEYLREIKQEHHGSEECAAYESVSGKWVWYHNVKVAEDDYADFSRESHQAVFKEKLKTQYYVTCDFHLAISTKSRFFARACVFHPWAHKSVSTITYGSSRWFQCGCDFLCCRVCVCV